MIRRSAFAPAAFAPSAFSALALSSLLLAACADTTVTQDSMVIDPHTITLTSAKPASVISVTHTCTCPFSWNSTVTPQSPWLTFPATMSGDNRSVAIAIDTARLSADTTRATILIQSTGNRYGSDTITVVAVK